MGITKVPTSGNFVKITWENVTVFLAQDMGLTNNSEFFYYYCYYYCNWIKLRIKILRTCLHTVGWWTLPQLWPWLVSGVRQHPTQGPKSNPLGSHSRHDTCSWASSVVSVLAVSRITSLPFPHENPTRECPLRSHGRGGEASTRHGDTLLPPLLFLSLLAYLRPEHGRSCLTSLVNSWDSPYISLIG